MGQPIAQHAAGDGLSGGVLEIVVALGSCQKRSGLQRENSSARTIGSWRPM
ncbi:MAG: hypothetical protein JRH16_07325 [Deltaproteobacteria bacterium]|nr:hypothetical protein [Deltaproteobacteria bacterium]MBW2362006.1 hypothetical protein [Deltaproteobacteria bacterium]